jgi:thiol-disulfide isomerase/thioredoxin
MNSFLNMNNNSILGQTRISNNNSWLSTIQSAGSNMNTSTLLIIVAVILFILVGASYYYFYVIPSTSAQYRANKELIDGKGSGDQSGSSNEAELIFFYADWCPHSKKAKPIWEEIKKTYENKTINGYTIVFTEIDSSTENAQVEARKEK